MKQRIPRKLKKAIKKHAWLQSKITSASYAYGSSLGLMLARYGVVGRKIRFES